MTLDYLSRINTSNILKSVDVLRIISQKLGLGAEHGEKRVGFTEAGVCRCRRLLIRVLCNRLVDPILCSSVFWEKRLDIFPERLRFVLEEVKRKEFFWRSYTDLR